MIQSMITSATTMGQLQNKLDVTSNNLANMNTTGYKRREVTFADLLFQQVNNQTVAAHEVGRTTPNGIRVGSGAAVAQTAMRLEQGAIQNTDRPLDLALTERGFFFEIAPSEDGTRRFTRDGAFYLSPNPDVEGENHLVNQNGDYVLSQAGTPITLPAGYQDITITESGTILVTDQNGNTEQVSQLQIVQVTKPQLMLASGENNFIFPNLEELELGFADVLVEGVGAAGAEVIQQRALEMSNVDMGREMTEMLLAQRNYQFNSQAISITDQMMGLVNNLR
ncbi:flagellar hook-basal body protein [Litchfieldia alkalitelluris]|uniref:Flagellar hook-basal body protein n=2 Tax=Evansella alkalicola TaxID=745819 RepID=A0ABS6K0G0_9BACI|nr:flagellar hook-basal body protein [Litchfieldia alkalitelluris]MBU9723419.1 flagellar hook-basal body protein [Bacillus alkalicola]